MTEVADVAEVVFLTNQCESVQFPAMVEEPSIDRELLPNPAMMIARTANIVEYFNAFTTWNFQAPLLAHLHFPLFETLEREDNVFFPLRNDPEARPLLIIEAPVVKPLVGTVPGTIAEIRCYFRAPLHGAVIIDEKWTMTKRLKEGATSTKDIDHEYRNRDGPRQLREELSAQENMIIVSVDGKSPRELLREILEQHQKMLLK